MPPSTTELRCRVAFPEFVTARITGLVVVPWVVVGKATEFGLIETAGVGGGGATPVPLRETVCGESGALSLMETLACWPPEAVGVNVMLIEQNLPGARTDGV